MQIAVVDDDPAVLALTGRMLAARGFHVRTYASAQKFLSDPPGAAFILLTDFDMPEMDGLALLQRLRGREGPAVPCLLMTGRTAADLPEEDRLAGIRGVLHKPFTLEELIQAVEGCLEQGF